MFWKKTPVATAELDSPDTIIGKDVYLEAICLTGQKSVRIEGEYKGSISIEGSLVLDDGGIITGDVIANYFLVAGEVNGNIRCATQVHLVSTAKVVGDIHTPAIIVDEGSQVSGRFIVDEERKSPDALLNGEEILHIQKAEDFETEPGEVLEEDAAEDAEEIVTEISAEAAEKNEGE